MNKTLIELFDIKPQNLHFTYMYIIGIIVQGSFHYFITNKLNIRLFLFYLLVAFTSSILYYKVFNIGK